MMAIRPPPFNVYKQAKKSSRVQQTPELYTFRGLEQSGLHNTPTHIQVLEF